MRRYFIASGVLLVLPVVNFAIAAPVLVQETRQTGVDVVHMPEGAITMLGERGELDDLEELLRMYEERLPKQAESSASHPSSSSPPPLPPPAPPPAPPPDHGWADVGQPQPSIPEEPSPVSSPGRELSSPESLTGSEYEMIEGDAPPGPSVGPDYLLPGMDAPLSSSVYPTWFHPANDLPGAPLPNSGTPNPRPSTELDSNNMLVVEEPSSRPASPAVFDGDHGYQVVYPQPR